MKYSAPRGTRDIIGDEVLNFRRIETIADGLFRLYGFEEIRTPVFETAELFSRAVGDTTDIVEKEMYVFQDRGGRSLSLRPEGTAGVVRAYLEHSWDKTGGGFKKLFYKGPMFRAERPQAGRYREFWQIGAEYFGNPSPEADAEVLFLVRDILDPVGAAIPVDFTLNSIGCAACRPVYREKLTSYLSAKRNGLCEDCQRRLDKNPLRALDCKTDSPQLSDAPRMADSLCEPCRRHDQQLEAILTSARFPYRKNPKLVRGLDYYNRTVFEVTSSALGAQDALAAGGRYDSLVKMLGGPDIPAIGFALGMDRVAKALCETPRPSASKKICVVLAGQGTGEAGFALVRAIRQQARTNDTGWSCEFAPSDKSLKAQFRFADNWGADHVIVIGETELARQKCLLKDLKESRQEEIDLPGSDPADHARFFTVLRSKIDPSPSTQEGHIS
ncbi:MAG TPA: histidine--tRNA ligase [Elusimicrobiota bacterium]|nr:histidine--tRNA ligase [Elusimicrobiota bacterium]